MEERSEERGGKKRRGDEKKGQILRIGPSLPVSGSSILLL